MGSSASSVCTILLGQTENVCLCSGVSWLVPWLLPAVTMQCESLRRTRLPIQTSLSSRWRLRWPKLTRRTLTASPGTQRRQDSWLPAAMTGISPSGGSRRKTEPRSTALISHWELWSPQAAFFIQLDISALTRHSSAFMSVNWKCFGASYPLWVYIFLYNSSIKNFMFI